jgi:phosphoribosyl 1,2-cyclic phosphate phosphodiesterase
MSSEYVLKVLGCGTSTGIPIPGCKCEVCLSDNPRNTRMKTSVCVEAPSGARVLIDASTDLRHQALKWGVERIDAVLFTHAHADHVLGIEDLRPFNFLSGKSIPCFGTDRTLADIRKIFSYIFEPDPDYLGGSLAKLTLHEFAELEPLTVADIPFTPLPLGHGPLPVTGFRVGNLGYATDCNVIPDESKEVLRGVKTLIIDGLRYEPHKTHFTIPDAIAAAQELGVEKTYLIHMTHSVEYEAVSAELPEGVELSYDGLTIPFEIS